MNLAPPEPLEFWFDLSSPYAYFAALEIDALGERRGREVAWRPFLLGVSYQTTGMKPLSEQPMRGAYAAKDWDRLARLNGRTFVPPARFPMRTQGAARMVYAVAADDPRAAKAFARRLLTSAFEAGRQIDEADVAAGVGAELGLDRDRLLAAASDPVWKAVLRARCAEAVGKGVFGSPFVIADGEPFWGADRLPLVDLWLQRGGW
jgi:2-hydroxychromene-2-carboxylate isomerase